MNNEEKIRELTERIEKLEKAENKRIIKKRIEITFKIIKLLVIIVLIIMAYNYIKPYKEKIDNVNEKVDKVENYINDKIGGLNKYFKSSRENLSIKYRILFPLTPPYVPFGIRRFNL